MQSVEDPGRLVHNPKPKWEVPLELIEWQPSYTQRVSNPRLSASLSAIFIYSLHKAKVYFPVGENPLKLMLRTGRIGHERRAVGGGLADHQIIQVPAPAPPPCSDWRSTAHGIESQ